MKYRVDAMSLRDGTVVLEGWAMPEHAEKIEYDFTARDGSPLKHTVVARDRADVMQQFGADRMCGFTLAAPFERTQDAYLVMRDGTVRRRVRVNAKVIEKKNSVRTKRTEKLLALCHFETLVVCWDFFRANGLWALWKKAVHKIQKIDEDYDYGEWQQKTAVPEEELTRQREAWKGFSFPGGEPPLISIVIPAWNTDRKYLSMLYDSLKSQTYPVFEVVTADGSDAGHGEVREVTESYAAQDPRFRYAGLSGNRGIAGNTNAGLEAARGAYIALCDHDDELPANALFEVAKAISEHPGAKFLYSDEDKVDFDGKALFEPHFKSGPNPELLTSVNYICHLSVIRRDLLGEVGGFRAEFDGAQDYDFFLRCMEKTVFAEREALAKYRAALLSMDRAEREKVFEECSGDGVKKLSEACGLSPESVKELLEGRFLSESMVHIPVICYHWRYHKNSTASDPKAKLYAFEAGSRAVSAHYERTGTPFGSVEKGVTYGYYHTLFKRPGPDAPLISVIIPNKDHREDLDKCIRSIAERSVYRNVEFVIVENNSSDPETFRYYEALETDPGYFGCTDMKVKVVRWEREFNYSAINNFGVREASGEYLLLLNNDMELRSPDTLAEMLSYVSRPEIGICGARLTYGDDTIQHAGVIVGLGGIAGAAFVGLHEKENSYMHRMMCVQDMSAVTAACLMTRRGVFEEAGGLSEDLAVAFNDIDFCLRVRRLGYRCVYDPYAVLYHYESKSRGLEDTPEKVRRFNSEIAVFAKNWGGILNALDPCYNPNLTLRKTNFALRDLLKEKPGEPYRLELDVEKQLEEVRWQKAKRGRI